MNPIVVKDKKGRVVLELNEDLCIYQISREARRKFRLSDIAKVERYGNNLKAGVSLKDRTGKEIAAFHMHMENGPEAMRFFRDCNQGKVTDKNGNPMPVFEIEVISANIPGILEEIPGFLAIWSGFWGIFLLTFLYDELLIGFDSAVDWVFLWLCVIMMVIPAFLYLFLKLLLIPRFLKSGLKGLRILSAVLNFGGIIMCCFLWKMPFSVMMRIDAVYPILVWILYVCFHKNMCWSPFDKKKVMVPYVGVLYFHFLSAYYTYIYNMNPDRILNVKWGIFALFAVLFLAFSYDCDSWLPRAGRIALLAWVTFLGMEGLPVLFDTGNTMHMPVEVLQKESIKSARNAEVFNIYISAGDGYTGKERISERLYNDIEIGDKIILCYHESSLSDYYYYHLPEDDCEYLWKIKEEALPWYE